MRFKKWLGTLVGVSFLLLGSGVSARAAAGDDDYPNALKSAPLGIAVENVFTPGTTANNKAKVVDTTNPDTLGTQAVVVTNGKNQFGTIWSTDDNAFDLTKDETVSMWMNYGSLNKKAADGMAFVLQNDARGLAATPKFGRKIYGETLGVWGVDNSSNQAMWVSEVAKTAILNSWALEFDTHVNDDNKYSAAETGNAFDTGLTGPHIASNYPGHGDAYDKEQVYSFFGTSSKWVSLLRHEGLIQGGTDHQMLANGAWHHVTVSWHAAAKQMTYTFDDKDPETGNDLTGESRTVDVDLKKIDPQGTGKIRWGFTGATGSDPGANLVIFEKVPGLVDSAAKNTLVDTTTNREIKDGDTIKGQDKVKLTYDLTYSGGKQDWKNVTARLKLPIGLDFDQVTITYANGESEEVDPVEITDHKLTHQLAHDLTTDNPTAKVTLTGRASDTKDLLEVAAQSSTFAANNGVATTDTSAFKIKPRLDIELSLRSAAEVGIEAGQTTTIIGQVLVPDGITVTNDDLTVHPIVNGQMKPAYQLVDPDDDASGKVTFTPDAGDLKAGKNTVELYVEDTYGNQSNPVIVTITVTGGLTFGTVASQSSFQQSELTGTAQEIKRTNDWDVQILDTRQAGSPWHLQVAATDFATASGKKLAGKLVYRDGDSRTTINGSPTTISAGQASGATDVTDVTKAGNDTTGLELTVGGGAAKGSYSADITWTLSDTPA